VRRQNHQAPGSLARPVALDQDVVVAPFLRSGEHAEAEEVGGLDDDGIVDRQRSNRPDGQLRRGAIKHRHVDPEGLIRRPPAQACCTGTAIVQLSGLRLREAPVARGHPRRAQPLPAKHDGIVEIHELRIIIQFEIREGERQPASAQQRRQEPLATKARELFDDGRKRRG
jgi:hypothetical protein